MPFGKAFDILVKPPPPDSRAALALRPPSLWRRASSSPRTKQRVRLFSSFHDIPDASGLKQRAGGRQQESSGSCERKHAAEAAGRKRNIPILHKCAEDYRAVCKDGKSKPEGPYVTYVFHFTFRVSPEQHLTCIFLPLQCFQTSCRGSSVDLCRRRSQ